METHVSCITLFPSDRSIFVDGFQLYPKHSQDVYNHSPDGFNWGYHGSGCAQAALGILLHFTNNILFDTDAKSEYRGKELYYYALKDIRVVLFPSEVNGLYRSVEVQFPFGIYRSYAKNGEQSQEKLLGAASRALASYFYQDFKREHVATWPQGEHTKQNVDVIGWLIAKIAEKGLIEL